MTSAVSQHLELSRRARQGDEQTLGKLLDEHRAYLKLLAQRAGGSNKRRGGGFGGGVKRKK